VTVASVISTCNASSGDRPQHVTRFAPRAAAFVQRNICWRPEGRCARSRSHSLRKYRFMVSRRSKALSCVNTGSAINQFIRDQLGKFRVAE